MIEFSSSELHILLTCVNESINFYRREIGILEDFACRSTLNYTLERNLILAKKIEAELLKRSM